VTWSDATDKLLAHFSTQWTALHSSIPIHFPNAKKLTPDASASTWLRLRFIPSYARRVVVGGQTRIQVGHVLVNTFVPLATGDGAQIDYDRDIEAIWETAHANGLDGAIHLGAPEPIPALPDPDVPMFRAGVTVQFTIDHTP
jgi:hypothetical protein